MHRIRICEQSFVNQEQAWLLYIKSCVTYRCHRSSNTREMSHKVIHSDETAETADQNIAEIWGIRSDQVSSCVDARFS